ncbi:MAG: D-aminoacyl-tRNA deacylase [Phycisphaerae bacterium]|jgi:D-tyrosyl-tRNA(Tyr) deacylase
MRAIVQRVKNARVDIDGKTVGQIDTGLLVYLGVGRGDNQTDAAIVAEKIANLRIFPDENDKMNRNIKDASGKILVVSNFTLFGDCRKGRRPDFGLAAEPESANTLYEKTAELIAKEGIEVQKGVFAADMQVFSQNDGPINFLIDSKKLF